MARMVLVAVVTVGALVAGCSSPEPTPSPFPPPTTRTPSADLVAWVDGVCEVRQDALWSLPLPAYETVPTETTRAALVAYLTASRDHFTQVVAGLDALGESPAAGGEEVRAAMRATVSELAGKLGEYAQHASVFPAPEFGAPYRLALDELATWSFGSPSLDDLAKEDPLVAAAREQAPNC